MQLRVRHVVATTGKMPLDPAHEPVSGVVKSALSLGAVLADQGYCVEAWGWNDTERPRRSVWNGVRLWTSPEWKWARFGRWDLRWPAPMAGRALTQPPVDVLHAHVDPNLLYMPRARIRVLHLHTPVPEPFPAAYERLLGRADAVICCSEFIRRRFLAAAKYPAGRTRVVYNGTELDTTDPQAGFRQRQQWGIGEGQPLLLYAGAIVKEKGVEHLIRAFAQVQAALPDAILVLVGSARLWATPGGNLAGDSYEAEMRNLAEGLNVRFVGSLPPAQMQAAFAAADVAVFPSVWDEPGPIVVIEALAAGLPVVASRVGGIPELIGDEKGGLLVPPGDEEELARTMKMLVMHEDTRRRMAEAARERSRALTWEASGRQLDDIYQALLAERRSLGVGGGNGEAISGHE